MPDFDLIASTIRGGVAVDEIEFEVPDAPPATAYLLGRKPSAATEASFEHDRAQPLVIAIHDERGDKATFLPDLEHLSTRGFTCLSVDSPVTRRAAADRDPLTAFDSQFAIVLSALSALIQPFSGLVQNVALLGRGLGGEVAASVASFTGEVQVVVAVAPLPDRSMFIERSSHPLAAGLRLFQGDEGTARQVAGLRPHRLIDQLDTAPATSWFLQVADDDDRLSDEDRATISLSIPRAVRVDHVANATDLVSARARRSRVDFISNLCN